MKIGITVKGFMDVPDDWGEEAPDVADYRYNEQLTVSDALNEIARKMSLYPDDMEVEVHPE